MTSLTISEAPPCEVAYIFEGEKTYAKLSKGDFEKILNERRCALIMAKLWRGLGLAAAILVVGTAYWFTEHPTTKVVMVAPADIK